MPWNAALSLDADTMPRLLEPGESQDACVADPPVSFHDDRRIGIRLREGYSGQGKLSLQSRERR